MTVKLEQDFFTSLRDHYRIDSEICTHEKAQQGAANANYFIRTDAEKYFLKIVAPRQELSLPRQLSFYAAIANSGIETIAPLKNKQGDYVTRIGDRKVMLFPYKEITEPEINAANIHIIGELTARLHLTKAAHLEKARYSKHFCLEAINAASDALKNKYAQYIPYIESISDRLPQGFVFDDICPDNLYAEKGAIRGFIDPENAGLGEYIFDIAGALIMCCFASADRFELCSTYLAAYTQKRSLTQEEKDNLFESLIMVCVHLSLFFELQPPPINTRRIALRLGFADLLIAMGKEAFAQAVSYSSLHTCNPAE